MDYRERYKPLYLGTADGNHSDYAVIEEHSNGIIDPGPLTYSEALAIADNRNALKAQRVRDALERS